MMMMAGSSCPSREEESKAMGASVSSSSSGGGGNPFRDFERKIKQYEGDWQDFDDGDLFDLRLIQQQQQQHKEQPQREEIGQECVGNAKKAGQEETKQRETQGKEEENNDEKQAQDAEKATILNHEDATKLSKEEEEEKRRRIQKRKQQQQQQRNREKKMMITVPPTPEERSKAIQLRVQKQVQRIQTISLRSRDAGDVEDRKVADFVPNPGATAYGFPQVQGFYVIKNALTSDQQMHWARECLVNYSHAEHTNLTNLGRHIGENMWATAMEKKDFQQFKQLRWSSLGYHYDWTARQYYPNQVSKFPEDLRKFASCFARQVGYDLHAEAAIVNYYPSNSMMGGHLDNAEWTMDFPIVSISLGCSAIFLIGGPTKETKPIGVVVESGDVVIMGGESRLAYHGVPRILEQHNLGTNGECLKEFVGDEQDEMILRYLRTARVNINMRQVNQTPPPTN